MDPAEREETHGDAEQLRQAPARIEAAPEAPKPLRPPLESLASNVGNRNFGALVSRMREGEGIASGGLVHPDVEAAIAAASGGGRPLDGGMSARLGPAYGDSLGDVRVHTGEHASALARAVAARAFTVGRDIFFGQGEYRPGSAGGDELIAHEVAHVVQQRGAPETGPLIVSQPGDALEREAEALSRDVNG